MFFIRSKNNYRCSNTNKVTVFIENSYPLSFDSWSTDRKTVETQLESQFEIGSTQNFKNPKYLIVALQIAARIVVPNKANNIAFFDNLNVRRYHVNIDGVRYPWDGLSIDYASNDYVDQYRDLILFCKEYVGEKLLRPFISYTDMKNKYPIQVIDLRFQVDHINPEKIIYLKNVGVLLILLDCL